MFRWVWVDEDERVLVRSNGRLSRWLGPGMHLLFTGFQRTRLERLDVASGAVAVKPEIYAVAPALDAEPVRIGALQIGLLEVDGRPARVLGPGDWLLVAGARSTRIRLIDAGDLVLELPRGYVEHIPQGVLLEVRVRAYERVLVYDGGRFERELGEGRWVLSHLGRALALHAVDLRERERSLVGQEVMTKDKVSLRLSLLLRYAIEDARRSVEGVRELEDALYAEAQLAARAEVAGRALDALLEDRAGAAARMRAAVAEQARAWGVRLHRLDVKDIVLPGDMKALLNRVIEAEKHAAAQVILRREETASTRSQANTARMLESNPMLVRLKTLETVERVASAVGPVTLVVGPSELESLRGWLAPPGTG